MKNTTLLRPRLVAAVGAVIALAVSGCAVDTSTPTTSDRVIESTTVAPASPAVDSPADRTDAVLQAVAADEGIHMPDGMASDYADIICEGLDDGLSPMALALIAANELTQWDDEQHAFLVGASIGAKCPEYSYLVGAAS